MFWVPVHAAGYKARICTQAERQGVEGLIQCAKRAGLGYLSFHRGRGVLPLGKTIYLVIEEQDINIRVPPEQVDEMVAAYGERIPVPRYDPYAQIGPAYFQARSNGCSPSVNGVHP